VLFVALPSAHAPPHDFVEGASLHEAALEPSHVPPQTAGSPAHFGRTLPRGAPVTGMQLPSLPGSAHDSHCPVHGAPQHTPSAQ